MKCCFKGCENKVFENLDKCALHCSSEIIIDENKYLSEFNNFFAKYILAKIKNLNGLRCEDWHDILQELSLKDISFINFHQNEILKEILNTKVIYIKNICFPKIKNKSLSNFHYITDQFDSIFFESCFFGCNAVVSKSHKYYYKECLFNGDLRIKASLMYLDKGAKENEGKKRDTLLLHEEVYRYSRCNFSGDVNITNNYDYKENSNYNYIVFNIFENCNFRGNISIENIRINSIFINFNNKNNYIVDKNKLDFKEISILECDFDSDFRLNGFENKEKFEDDDITESVIIPVKINKIFVKDTKFNKKFEIKNSEVGDFKFKNSNVEKVFDAFESRFEKLYFYKSIFTDFAGFEKVEFGLEGQDVESYQAKFIYTTFMSFSNFRRTRFLSGLDFENSNLKEQPNFLKTKISPKNTNRETFRIIKNSFESVGNKLEANKFFVLEMDAYRKDLFKDLDRDSEEQEVLDKRYSEKFIFVSNWLISGFGRSYIRPLLLLISSIFAYNIFYNFYEMFYKTDIYSLPRDISIISDSLNNSARSFFPFSRFVEKRTGFEFISLLFVIWFAILTWQIVVAVKRNTQH